MVSFKEKEKMMKSLKNFGLSKTCATIIASLIRLKENIPSLSHSKQMSSFSNLLMGLTILTKFGTNLLINLIWPKKDCKDFLSLERGIFLMASTLAVSIVIPSLEMMCPSNLAFSTPKIDFLGLREMPYSLHLWKIVLKC
jgi:hypothetical protein